MFKPRYYGTVTTLPNGELYVQGGKGGASNPEIRGLDGTFRQLTGASTFDISWSYPRNFVAPDGRIFGIDISGRMYYVSTDGVGAFSMAGTMPTTDVARISSSSVMYEPGRILTIGGATLKAMLTDIRGGTPIVTQTQSLPARRIWANATVLPDGRVVATGGSGVQNELTDVVNFAEIWDPRSGTWTRGAEGTKARLYHSLALLLPDATLLVAGGGAPGPLTNLNAEIYRPPYLYNSSGALASRPQITSAPDTMGIGPSGAASLWVSQMRRVSAA
jgi:hypothetical protein